MAEIGMEVEDSRTRSGAEARDLTTADPWSRGHLGLFASARGDRDGQ